MNDPSAGSSGLSGAANNLLTTTKSQSQIEQALLLFNV